MVPSMKHHVRVFICVLFLLTLFFKQTVHATGRTSYANCESYMECAQQIADEEQNRIISTIESLKHKTEGFIPCDEDLLTFEQDYVNWFLKNKTEFQNIYDVMTNAVKIQNQNFSAVNDQSVDVIPTASQTNQNTVPVNLQKIQAYLTQLNGRLKTCPDEQLDFMMKGVENPQWNETNIAHSQVGVAIEKINVLLASSIQQKNLVSKIILTQDLEKRKTGHAMTLVLQTTLNDTPLLNLDLLKTSHDFLTEAQKWKLITSSGVLIDGYPIDGEARYAAMNKKRANDCSQTQVTYFTSHSAVPFVAFPNVATVASKMDLSKTAFRMNEAHHLQMVDQSSGKVFDIDDSPVIKSIPLTFKLDKNLLTFTIDQDNSLSVFSLLGNSWDSLGGEVSKITSVTKSGDGYFIRIIGIDRLPYQKKSSDDDWEQK